MACKNCQCCQPPTFITVNQTSLKVVGKELNGNLYVEHPLTKIRGLIYQQEYERPD